MSVVILACLISSLSAGRKGVEGFCSSCVSFPQKISLKQNICSIRELPLPDVIPAEKGFHCFDWAGIVVRPSQWAQL